MKTIQVLLLIVLISASVSNARHFESDEQSLDLDLLGSQPDDVKSNVNHNKHPRHRNKRQHVNYPDSWRPNYPDYSRRSGIESYDTCPEREILPKIMKVMAALAEKDKVLTTPNIIVNCGADQGKNPSIEGRLKIDDRNRNWGMDTRFEPKDNDQFTRRPLNLDPVTRKPNTGVNVGNEDPRGQTLNIFGGQRNPNVCDFAYLACCHMEDYQDRQGCFYYLGCKSGDFRSCDPKSKKEAFELFEKSYITTDG